MVSAAAPIPCDNGGIDVGRNDKVARFLSNAHTHTLFCDGRCAPDEMLAAAKQLGFISLGFSDHGEQGFDFAYCMGHGKQRRYENTLRAMQAKHQDEGKSPRLWIGLEQDAMVDETQKTYNKKHFDFIVGSTHYLTRDFHGEPVAVDGNFNLLKIYVSEAFRGDWMAMVHAYYDAHVSMLRRDQPQIIGHFDLVRRQNLLAELFCTPAYRKAALAALESIDSFTGVLEVNTGGMAKGVMDEPYPTRELLGAWLEMGGKVTITSDCHDARRLDFGFDRMLEMLKRIGYKRVKRLGAGAALWETVEL